MESGKQKTKHQKNKNKKRGLDWIGVIHSINRITRIIDIKIPMECKMTVKGGRVGYSQVYINDMVYRQTRTTTEEDVTIYKI